ncbi:MAG: YihY/virulence factor BrkB family protein [bacterium]|nr:YihY/virulence factor BrkB family protein [bacterium]
MTKHMAIFRIAFFRWQKDNGARLGAALAYYTVFSIVPLLFLATLLTSVFFGESAARGEVVTAIESVVGTSAAETIEAILAGLDEHATGLLQTVFGLAVLVFGASGIFLQIRSALNYIWRVEARPQFGTSTFVQQYVLALLMVVLVGAALIIIMTAGTLLTALEESIASFTPDLPFLWEAVYLGVVFLLTVMFIVIIFDRLPNTNIVRRDILAGAFVTALFLSLGNIAVSVYFNFSTIRTIYGALSSLLFILLWIYYSAQVFYFGAEWLAVYADKKGSGILPDRYARPIPERHDFIERPLARMKTSVTRLKRNLKKRK